MTTTKYPLTWPEGWPRTVAHARQYGKFNKKVMKRFSGSDHSYQQTENLSLADAVNRATTQLSRLGIDFDDFIISTNVVTRLDGLPKSGQRKPEDPGVAVYWQDDLGRKLVIAIDLYTTVADNLAAIAATIEALRGIERWGGAQIIERAFTGFDALPSPDVITPARAWWDELGVDRDAPEHEIEHRYKIRRKETHTDHGGDDDAFMAVQRAIKDARKERGFA